jgi:hypothetical protein
MKLSVYLYNAEYDANYKPNYYVTFVMSGETILDHPCVYISDNYDCVDGIRYSREPFEKIKRTVTRRVNKAVRELIDGKWHYIFSDNNNCDECLPAEEFDEFINKLKANPNHHLTKIIDNIDYDGACIDFDYYEIHDKLHNLYNC